MNLLPAVVTAIATVGSGVLIGLWAALLISPAEIVHAIGVVSQCGIYAVATIDSSGAVEVYNAAREAPAAVEALVNALPPEARITVLVPCPFQVPGV